MICSSKEFILISSPENLWLIQSRILFTSEKRKSDRQVLRCNGLSHCLGYLCDSPNLERKKKKAIARLDHLKHFQNLHINLGSRKSQKGLIYQKENTSFQNEILLFFYISSSKPTGPSWFLYIELKGPVCLVQIYRYRI